MEQKRHAQVTRPFKRVYRKFVYSTPENAKNQTYNPIFKKPSKRGAPGATPRSFVIVN